MDKVFPLITVIITTHNRTNIAKYVLSSIIRNLKYPNFQICIADDLSDDSHIKNLEHYLTTTLDFHKYFITTTTKERHGLGASLNNALKKSFEYGDIVLTTEDDWVLERELDLTKYVEILNADHNIAMIRLAALMQRLCIPVKSKYNDLVKIVGKRIDASICNMQVALRHKRLYDALGYYVEDTNTDTVENEFVQRYNKLSVIGNSNSFQILFPSTIKYGTLDDPSLYFIHIGKSTVGHVLYDIPKRYKFLYQRNNAYIQLNKKNTHFFNIIIPTYNSYKFLERCIQSVETQTFTDYTITIADDCSTDKTAVLIAELAKKHSNIQYVILKQHADAGGARNAALDLDSSATYTTFLDSDDYYENNNVLQMIFDKATSTNMPDLVKIGLVKHYKNSEDMVLKYSSNQLKNIVWVECPCTSVIKTNLIPKFIANRRRFNDVVWYYRLCDTINTIEILNDARTIYTMDQNVESCQHAKLDNTRIAAIYQLISDLILEKFNKPEVNTVKQYVIESKIKELKRNNFYLDKINWNSL